VKKIVPKAGLRRQLAASLKECRSRLGLTQEELAWRAGLHRSYVADIERGARNLSLASIEKLASALNISIASLFGDTARAGVPRNGERAELVDILLVEDNPDDAELALQAFKSARVHNKVYVAEDGEAALDFLKDRMAHIGGSTECPRLVVLLDLNLPKMSGLDVLRRMKTDARTRKIPVIVLTVSQRDRDIAECRKLGADFYIVKPVDFQNFSQVTPHFRLHWALFHSAARTTA